jgi:hypothetical protein
VPPALRCRRRAGSVKWSIPGSREARLDRTGNLMPGVTNGWPDPCFALLERGDQASRGRDAFDHLPGYTQAYRSGALHPPATRRPSPAPHLHLESFSIHRIMQQSPWSNAMSSACPETAWGHRVDQPTGGVAIGPLRPAGPAALRRPHAPAHPGTACRARGRAPPAGHRDADSSAAVGDPRPLAGGGLRTSLVMSFHRSGTALRSRSTMARASYSRSRS